MDHVELYVKGIQNLNLVPVYLHVIHFQEILNIVHK